jgi:hypothetical protein
VHHAPNKDLRWKKTKLVDNQIDKTSIKQMNKLAREELYDPTTIIQARPAAPSYQPTQVPIYGDQY